MASHSELLEYSSPAKRRKIDSNDRGTSEISELDIVDKKQSYKTIHNDLEGIFFKISLINDENFTFIKMAAIVLRPPILHRSSFASSIITGGGGRHDSCLGAAKFSHSFVNIDVWIPCIP